MRVKYVRAVVSLFLVLSLIQNPSARPLSGASSQDRERQEQELEARRQNFGTGRQLLLDKGVPFDPDELLHDGWPQKLKGTLDTMPEMHQIRYETAPMKGAYLADTLYLPEQVKLSGHTIIVANYVVFEGKNPVIRGNYDVHFFPAKPVAVLETTVAQILKKQGALLNVNFGRSLPSFSLIQQVIPATRHTITIDTSGPAPQTRTRAPRKSDASLKTASWNEAAVFPWQSGCNTGCNNSGNNGLNGTSGAPGGPGANGINPKNSPDGNCTSPTTGSNNGVAGVEAGDGGTGFSGGDGAPGGTGFNAAAINGMVADNDLNTYDFIANGGPGGLGGEGGSGGTGGNGGNGSNGGNGVACGCLLGTGGQAGAAGTGGDGGNGGNGASGGTGGNGAAITVSLPFNSPGANTSNSGGVGGLAGVGGAGSAGGQGAWSDSPEPALQLVERKLRTALRS